MFKNISIKLRLTILTAILLTTVCIVLTSTSISSSGIFFPSSFERITLDKEVMSQIQVNQLPVSKILAEIDNTQKKFAYEQLLYMMIVICIGTVASYFLAGRALMPITMLSKEIENIDEHNLKIRINVPNSNDEVSTLANSFNQLLSIMDSAFESQKLFTQNVAHELKTPLTSIMANIDVMDLDEEPSNEELLEVVNIAKKNIERLSIIVSDVLSLNTFIDKESMKGIDFANMVSEIENEVSDLIIGKNITVIREGNTIIFGNRSLLYRAFHNIILNAVRYNKDNGTIKIICEDNKIIISDTGVGIQKDSIDKIFEPFYCVDNSRSKSLGGSGLGLSIVKSVIDKHNFKINIESEINIGTKIIITI